MISKATRRVQTSEFADFEGAILGVYPVVLRFLVLQTTSSTCHESYTSTVLQPSRPTPQQSHSPVVLCPTSPMNQCQQSYSPIVLHVTSPNGKYQQSYIPIVLRFNSPAAQQSYISLFLQTSINSPTAQQSYVSLLNLGVGLLGCRTIDQKDYWAVGLMICSTTGLWNC